MLAKATMSTSSTSISNEHKRDWLDLPSDVTANILQRVGVVDILENAQKVCTAWRKICKDPTMWRVINMVVHNFSYPDPKLMCKHAIDRSQGQLVDITIEGSCNDELLSYVANRSRQLRRLEIVFRHVGMLTIMPESLMKFPLLEELNLYSVYISKEDIEIAGRYCPMLKTVKVNQPPSKCFNGYANEVAIAIGENLHEIRHLELIGNNMSNFGLQAILDGCLCLETLDLRNCVLIDLNGDMGKRCFKQIKTLKLPNDSLEGSPYSYIYEDLDSLEGSPYSYTYEDLELYEDDLNPIDPDLYEGYFSN